MVSNQGKLLDFIEQKKNLATPTHYLEGWVKKKKTNEKISCQKLAQPEEQNQATCKNHSN